MASRYNLRILDYNSELSSFGLPGIQLSQANFDAQVALWDTLQTSVDGLVIGVLNQRQLQAQQVEISSVPPASQFAQRETKWLVTWVDNVIGTLHQTEIPTADLALLTAGAEMLNLGAGAGLAFKNAFEAVVRWGGVNAVTVQSVRHVGRNL